MPLRAVVGKLIGLAHEVALPPAAGRFWARWRATATHRQAELVTLLLPGSARVEL